MAEYEIDEIKNAVSHFNWENYSQEEDGHETAIALRGHAVLVTKEDSRRSSYDDYDNDMYVVFKVGEQLFRKSGWYDSYEENDWDGALEEVVVRKMRAVEYAPKRS